MKTVFYWCPFISKVATVRSVIKSSEALKKFSKNEFEPTIVNVAGEWNSYKNEENTLGLKIIDLTNSKILDGKNWTGFWRSRLIYMYIIIIAFIPLIRLLKKYKPDFFILHLISSLPLIANFFFRFKVKIILRISGMPKFNFFRTILWKYTVANINLVTTPTIGTYNDLKEIDYLKNKIRVLFDPIITPSEILKKKIEKINDNIFINSDFKKFFISIGRFTKQKNFSFLIDCFSEVIKVRNDAKLLIVGTGELKDEMQNKINQNKVNKNIKLIPFKNNIYNYLNASSGFILSSLWEDPGFVLIEAAYLNVPILSSDCKNGPKEILNNGDNGILFKSNNKKSFIENFKIFSNLNEIEKKIKILKTKKYIKKFTVFSHYKQIVILLREIS